MTDVTNLKLGKKLGVVHDPRTFQLRALLPATPPAVPPSWRMARKLRTVPMFANDRYGCCTLASNGHRIVAQEHSTQQHEIAVDADDVLEAYSAVTGFDPARPETDNGAYMLDVANHMRRVGLGREKDGSRHMIDAFVKVDHRVRLEVKTACALFGGVWVGVWLPISAQRQTGSGRTWDLPPEGSSGNGEPGSWGGHAIEVVGYDLDGLTLFTWGAEQRMTWSFWNAYVDESYAFISEDWFRKSGTTPRGFNRAQLDQWLSALS